MYDRCYDGSIFQSNVKTVGSNTQRYGKLQIFQTYCEIKKEPSNRLFLAIRGAPCYFSLSKLHFL
jgi:hypothetical protein